MEHLKLHLILNIKVMMDLCLLNAILGISSHGGKFSCSFCDGQSTLQSFNLCTFGHLHENYQKFLAAGAKPAVIKQFFNVIQPCLTIAGPEKLVMEVHPLPELHILLGVVNHLVKLCINVDNNTLGLLKRHNIFQHGYQGGGLDGSNSFKWVFLAQSS